MIKILQYLQRLLLAVLRSLKMFCIFYSPLGIDVFSGTLESRVTSFSVIYNDQTLFWISHHHTG
jgi:hypothetical protein